MVAAFVAACTPSPTPPLPTTGAAAPTAAAAKPAATSAPAPAATAAPAPAANPTAAPAAAAGAMTEVGTPRSETLIVQTFDGKADNPSNMNPLSGSYALWRG